MFASCINEAVDSTMSHISSNCVEWWSPFLCSLCFGLFQIVFEILQMLFEKYINDTVDRTISQISSSCVEWWSSFVCSFLLVLFRNVLYLFKPCLTKQEACR